MLPEAGRLSLRLSMAPLWHIRRRSAPFGPFTEIEKPFVEVAYRPS
jgi:hypothetical protein